MKALPLVVAALAAGMLATTRAHADALSEAEMVRLARGDSVERPQAISRAGRRYVGGVAYVLVDAGLDSLSSVFSDVEAWRRILPHARTARHVGAVGDDELVEMTHSAAFVQATYTMRVHRDDHGMRFWLAPQRPHDVEDAWGFVRAEPVGDRRTLITYGILIDMGPGMLRDLFEGTVRRLALSVPDRVRDFALAQASRPRVSAP